jgi:hypothetical protein
MPGLEDKLMAQGAWNTEHETRNTKHGTRNTEHETKGDTIYAKQDQRSDEKLSRAEAEAS